MYVCACVCILYCSVVFSSLLYCILVYPIVLSYKQHLCLYACVYTCTDVFGLYSHLDQNPYAKKAASSAAF